MCWNAEVSLKSFAMGVLSILIGFVYGVPLPLLFFCSTIVLMQLIEYVVWSNYTNQEINKKASLAAIGLLSLQPVASILTLTSLPLQKSLLILYFITGGLSIFFSQSREFRMTKAENGHLAWNWLEHSEVSLLVYFIFLLVPLLLNKAFILLGLSLFTLIVSLYTYHKENTWGSMWCWIVNGIVPLAIGSSILTKST